jgi:hypothetical protein
MPNIYFTIFELIIYIQLAICIRHAWNHRPANLLRLFFGVAFGILLEIATIRQLHAYTYGQFWVMVLDVPLCIGVGWGCIIYSAMEFSDASSLPYWTRPVLDGLLAINIDLAMDAVAIRFGFWDWGPPLTANHYFGVPYANFWAWFWVVLFFSLGHRLLARRTDWVGKYLSAPMALLVGLVGVLGTNYLISFHIPFDYHWLTAAILLFCALLFVFSLKPRFYITSAPALVFWVPFLTHVYLLISGGTSGIFMQTPFLLAMGVLMLGIELALHRRSIGEILQPLIKKATA